MNYIEVTINKPFDHTAPNGKYNKGDVGIYDKYVIQAKKTGRFLKIITPEGVCYADPVSILKNCQYIFRYYKLDTPMKLFIIKPRYIDKPTEEMSTTEALSGMPDQYREKLRAIFKK